MSCECALQVAAAHEAVSALGVQGNSCLLEVCFRMGKGSSVAGACYSMRILPVEDHDAPEAGKGRAIALAPACLGPSSLKVSPLQHSFGAAPSQWKRTAAGCSEQAG